MSKLFRYGGRVVRLTCVGPNNFILFKHLSYWPHFLMQSINHDTMIESMRNLNYLIHHYRWIWVFWTMEKKKKNRLKRKVVSYKLQTMNQSDWRLIYKEPINRFYYSRNYILGVIFGGQSTILNVHLGILIFISIFY